MVSKLALVWEACSLFTVFSDSKLGIMKKVLIMILAVFLGNQAYAQSDDPVVMKVNGREVLRSEFAYLYRRDCATQSQPLTAKKYAEQFVNRKLKVLAAERAGLDTGFVFRKQQENYRIQLMQLQLPGRALIDSLALRLYANQQTNVGRVQVAQIFRRLPQNITPHRLHAEEQRMDSIYRALSSQPDADFTGWVKQYSDDQRPLWIDRVQTTTEFGDVAFSLPKGSYSAPFFTAEGLHILKVIDKDELPRGKSKENLAGQLWRSNTQYAGLESVAENLKAECRYTPDQAGLNELLSKGETSQTLFLLGEHPYNGAMFKRFAASYPQALKRQLDAFTTKSLLDYASRNLVNDNPDTHYALLEYREDQLATEMTDREIGQPAVDDRAGLATYFKFHKSDYKWDSPRYKGAVLHCADKKTAKAAKKMLKKLPWAEWESILQKTLNASGEEKVQIESGLFAEGDNKYIDKLVFKKGDFTSDKSKPFTIAVGRKEKAPDSYTEVLDAVRKDYQNYLSTRWIEHLKESGKVEINQEVLKTVNNL